MDDQVRDGRVASCAWLRGSAKMLDAVIWRLTAVYLHLTEPTRASLKATLDKLMTDL